MGTIQRWYVYVVAAVTLQATTWAIINLLRNLLIRQTNADSAETALMMSIIIIGLPLFIVHWLWAQRKVNAGLEERGALVRLLYLYIMMAAFLLPLIQNSYRAVQALIHIAFGISPNLYTQYFLKTPAQRFWYNLIPIIILSVLWAYHRRLRVIDASQTPENDLTRTVRQIYLYFFAAIGLLILSIGVVGGLHWLFNQIVPQAGSRVTFGSEQIAAALTRILIGISLWLVFWLAAQRLFDHPDNSLERVSTVRKLYLYVVIFSGVMSVVIAVALVLGDLLERLLDVTTTFSDGDIRLPLSVVIVAGCVWGYNAFVLRQDSELVDSTDQQRLVRRFYLYLTAAIGLLAVLIGVSGVLSVLIRAAASSSGFYVDLRRQLAWFTALLLAGLPVWLVNWLRAQKAAQEATQAGHQERASLVRRSYLYGFLLIATLVILVGAIYIMSQFIELMLGSRESNFLLRDVGQATAYVVVMLAVWLYHGTILRRDSALVKRMVAERMKPLYVAVVDMDDGMLGRMLIEKIGVDVPNAQVMGLGLNPVAASVLESADNAHPFEETLASADVIIGPWQMAVASESGNAMFATQVTASPAHKVMLPIPTEGWDWVGIERQKHSEIVKDTVTIVKQIADDEDVHIKRRFSPGMIALIVIAALFLLCTGVPFLLSLFSMLMYGY